MSSYKEMLRKAAELLAAAEVPDAGVDAWYLMEHVTGMNRATYFLKVEEEMPPAEQEAYEKLLEKRRGKVNFQRRSS